MVVASFGDAKTSAWNTTVAEEKYARPAGKIVESGVQAWLHSP